MIPLVPLIASAIQAIVYKKVEQAIIENGAAALFPKPKLEPRVKLEGRKTYIGIIVLLAGALAPKLGLTEGEVGQIVDAVLVIAGGLMALYGRWDASRRAKK